MQKGHPQSLILTSTRRLALRLQESLYPKDKGQVQPKRSVYALNDWYHTLWKLLQVGGMTEDWVLLSDLQEQALWVSVIQGTEYYDGLLQPLQTAKSLMNTWKLLNQWEQSIHDIDWSANDEGNIFYRWASSFEETLEKRRFLSSSQMPIHLMRLMAQNSEVVQLFTSQKVCMMGFDDFPPQLKRVMDVLRGLSLEVEVMTPEQPASQVHRAVFSDRRQELETVAHLASVWAKTHAGPVGIIVPDLLENRRMVEQVFGAYETSSYMLPEKTMSWHANISAGVSLYEYPIVYAFFKSLRLLQSNMSTIDLLFLLRSPFIKQAEEESIGRVLLTKLIKDTQRTTFDLVSLKKLSLKTHQNTPLPHWLAILEQAEKIQYPKSKANSIKEIEGVLQLWIEAIDWPGERPLNSIEYQVVQRFFMCLKSWRALDAVVDTISFYDAIAWLERVCVDVSFQPESNAVKIHIMGLLEASGQTFEKLFVTGMHAECLPAPASPNPFIPIPLQKELEMPHASAHRELLFAQNLLNSLMTCSDKVMFSHFEKNQGRDFQVSPLLADIKICDVKPYQAQSLTEQLESKTTTRQMIESVPVKKDEILRGGVSLIADMAQCAFKAFAIHRLHAKTAETLVGISPKVRGILMHHALERLWNTIKTQEQLLKFTDAQLLEKIENCLTSMASLPHLAEIPSLYWQVERQRLSQILLSWFALEKTRDSFKVLKTEVNTEIRLYGLTLKARLDRVDVTQAGEHLVIDYKTGLVDLKECFGDRPDAPQLPLYCFADFPKNPTGIVFGILKREGCQFIGLTKQEALLPKVSSPERWEEVLFSWEKTLNNLSRSFSEGQTDVNPKSPKSCQYCNVVSVCRVRALL